MRKTNNKRLEPPRPLLVVYNYTIPHPTPSPLPYTSWLPILLFGHRLDGSRSRNDSFRALERSSRVILSTCDSCIRSSIASLAGWTVPSHRAVYPQLPDLGHDYLISGAHVVHAISDAAPVGAAIHRIGPLLPPTAVPSAPAVSRLRRPVSADTCSHQLPRLRLRLQRTLST